MLTADLYSMGTVEHNARAGANPAVPPKDAGHGGRVDTTVELNSI